MKNKDLFLIPLIVVLYVIWLPIAIIKDICILFCIPFDMDRFLNTMGAARKNIRNSFNFLKDINKEAEEPEVKEEEQKTVGFKIMPSNIPSLPEVSSGIGSIEDDEEE